MLLDLDQGSTTVWKNDAKLGAMQAEGRSGRLCWAIVVANGPPGSGASSQHRRHHRQQGGNRTCGYNCMGTAQTMTGLY